MYKVLLVIFTLIINVVAYSQRPNVAVIIDDETRQNDTPFISKICVMLFLGVVALLSYLKFRKTER